MPFLSEQDRTAVAERTRRNCNDCQSEVHNEYCSRCDEFYSEGHQQQCRSLDARHDHSNCGGDRGIL